MISKTLTYQNYDGESVTETLFFNLNQVEQARFESAYVSGGYKDLKQYLDSIVEKKDMKALIEILEDVILSSYGKREPDGIHFTKNKMLREEFSNSIAYAELFEEFITKPEEFKRFVNGVLPKKQQEALVQQS